MKVRVGFFDSGIGGLSILAALDRQYPHLFDCFYCSDHSFAPYGDRPDELIIERSLFIARFLKEQGCQIIVVACNTATAVAIDRLRQQISNVYFVGVEPYLNILHRHDCLVEQAGPSKTAVMTTPVTARSQRFLDLRKRIDPDQKLEYFSCPTLATLVEKIFIGTQEQGVWDAIDYELGFLKDSHFKRVILGCTHYNFLAEYIEQSYSLQAISVSEAVARRIFSLAQNHLISDEQWESDQKNGHRFYSGPNFFDSEEVLQVPAINLLPKAMKAT